MRKGKGRVYCNKVTMGITQNTHYTYESHKEATRVKDCRVYQAGNVWSFNTPAAFGRMQWGWSQPGQAPCTAGGRHTQTACLTRAWPGQEKGPPQVATRAPGGVGKWQGGGQVSAWKASTKCLFQWQQCEMSH